MFRVGHGEAGKGEDRIGKGHTEAPTYRNILGLIQGMDVWVLIVLGFCKPYLYFMHSL